MNVGERKILTSTEKYGKVTTVCLGYWDSPDADIRTTFSMSKEIQGFIDVWVDVVSDDLGLARPCIYLRSGER